LEQCFAPDRPGDDAGRSACAFWWVQLIAYYSTETMSNKAVGSKAFSMRLAEEPAPDMMSIMAVVFGLMGLLLNANFEARSCQHSDIWS